MSYLTEKSISELLEIKGKLLIPSYQRGYRWTEIQVQELLNDIWDFILKANKKDGEWYCLQPIVVKKINDDFEVLDGQQRLTTIFLILKYLEGYIEAENKAFQIKYKTRNADSANSEDFLRDINLKTETDSSESIDYFYMFQAYNAVKAWFKEKANNGYKSISSKFISPFLEDAKVIWYEVDSAKDAIEIFTRINMGKIPLTNAELVKALFLNVSNFPDTDIKEIELKQLEISSEWDRMELALQNPGFWYFINNHKNQTETRIEYIFDLAEKVSANKNNDEKKSVFYYFSEKFKTKNKNTLDDAWKEVKRIFQTIEEWFYDKELYHKIGYLITVGGNISELLKIAENNKKTQFRKELDANIDKKIQCNDLEVLEYGKNNSLIRNILLLHNIKTLLASKNESSRFPFDKYKEENWDIEHIHAVATEMPKNKQHRIDWLSDSKVFISDNKELMSEIIYFIENYDKLIESNSESFDKVATDILEYFSKKSNVETDINDLSNLVLLDSGTNRSYKNAIFPVKRKSIIEKEKTGTFIPICTRNVFLKYYTQNVSQMTFWDSADRKEYFSNLRNVIQSKEI